MKDELLKELFREINVKGDTCDEGEDLTERQQGYCQALEEVEQLLVNKMDNPRGYGLKEVTIKVNQTKADRERLGQMWDESPKEFKESVTRRDFILATHIEEGYNGKTIK